MGIKRSLRERGFLESIRYAILKFLKLEHHQEETDSLYYFLNQYTDITALPPTNDSDLRIMQKCDAEFLSLFDKFCKMHDLRYWLDFGTLLGAVRHEGFIPWDDDTDVAMLRGDFNRLLDCKEELNKMGVELTVKHGGWIGLGYKHEQTGIWIDVFPKDLYYSNDDAPLVIQTVKNKLYRYRKKFGLKNITSQYEILKKQIDSIFGNKTDGAKAIVYQGLTIYNSVRANCYEDIFPLQKIEFEGKELYVPRNLNNYLHEIYGQDYMSFPRRGILYHDGGRGALSTWAKRNGTDMNSIMQELKSLQERFD